MRKILFILAPFIVIVLVFSAVIFFLSHNRGKGALQVTSMPPSKVYLNGKLIGQTPLCKCELKDMIDANDYTIKLIPTQGNLEPFEQKITISPKVLTVVDRNFALQGLGNGSVISLTPISDKKDAQISIISFPNTTEIFLDNNLEGQAPLLLKNITESDHELKLTKEGYKDKIVRIRTVLGYRLDALIFLGINPDIATTSATQISSPSATITPSVAKVLILETPTGFLRVRDAASLGGIEIGQVKPGETYPLLDEKSGWYQIKFNDQEGWVSSQYSEKQ